MKFLKKTCCLVMVIVMMSLLALPASATASPEFAEKVEEEFSNFPVLRMNTSYTEFVKLVQRFLLVYPETHETIYNTDNTYHGIDGGFGYVTEEAVMVFQSNLLGRGEADGIVGANTWGKILDCLIHYPVEEHYVYYRTSPMNNKVVMTCIPMEDNTYPMYTLRYDHSEFPYPFHRFTFVH